MRSILDMDLTKTHAHYDTQQENQNQTTTNEILETMKFFFLRDAWRIYQSKENPFDVTYVTNAQARAAVTSK